MLSQSSISLLLIPLALAQSSLDFVNYPSAAKPCLVSAATQSNCSISTVAAFNTCVCSNGGNFITYAVQCINSYDSGDLNSVYGQMASNCADSNTPVPYTLEQFLALASSATTSITPTSTGSSSSTSSASAADSTSKKLGTTSIIGIAVGVPLLLALLGLAGVLIWAARRKDREGKGKSARDSMSSGALGDYHASDATSQGNRFSTMSHFTPAAAPVYSKLYHRPGGDQFVYQQQVPVELDSTMSPVTGPQELPAEVPVAEAYGFHDEKSHGNDPK